MPSSPACSTCPMSRTTKDERRATSERHAALFFRLGSSGPPVVLSGYKYASYSSFFTFFIPTRRRNRYLFPAPLFRCCFSSFVRSREKVPLKSDHLTDKSQSIIALFYGWLLYGTSTEFRILSWPFVTEKSMFRRLYAKKKLYGDIRAVWIFAFITERSLHFRTALITPQIIINSLD